MLRTHFTELAGGIFQAHRSWSRLSSDDKYNEFWAFFDEANATHRSIYASIDVRDLLRQGTHSVEHIVPRTLLEFELARARTRIRRGATVNPLNFAASHRDTNTHRGHAIFDFDGDSIQQRSRIELDAATLVHTGMDHEGQWVVPPRTRGDIARAVIYMFLVYPLPRLRPHNATTLLTWHKHDQPSRTEQEYNAWVFARKAIHNPLIGTPTIEPVQLDPAALFRSLTE